MICNVYGTAMRASLTAHKCSAKWFVIVECKTHLVRFISFHLRPVPSSSEWLEWCQVLENQSDNICITPSTHNDNATVSKSEQKDQISKRNFTARNTERYYSRRGFRRYNELLFHLIPWETLGLFIIRDWHNYVPLFSWRVSLSLNECDALSPEERASRSKEQQQSDRPKFWSHSNSLPLLV